MPVLSLKASCHPERRHQAFGLCNPCYQKKYQEKHRQELLVKQRERWHRVKDFQRTKDQTRKGNLRRRFGLTPEQYADMVVAQNGRCAVCFRPETAVNQYGVKALAVDHDHSTGVVRGLLCMRCNIVLGLVKDDTDILQSAIEYLSDIEKDGVS